MKINSLKWLSGVLLALAPVGCKAPEDLSLLQEVQTSGQGVFTLALAEGHFQGTSAGKAVNLLSVNANTAPNQTLTGPEWAFPLPQTYVVALKDGDWECKGSLTLAQAGNLSCLTTAQPASPSSSGTVTGTETGTTTGGSTSSTTSGSTIGTTTGSNSTGSATANSSTGTVSGETIGTTTGDASPDTAPGEEGDAVEFPNKPLSDQ